MNLDINKQELINSLREHDLGTFEHSKRVADLAHGFGMYLGYHKDDLRLLHEAAALHDIGKLNVDSGILNSKERLADDEFAEIVKHTIYSEDILKKVNTPDKMLRAVRSHHENYNGTGYPDRLTCEEINTEASIIRIIDSYDSMVNDRPYKKGISNEEALKEIATLREILYRPDLVDKFIVYMKVKKIEH